MPSVYGAIAEDATPTMVTVGTRGAVSAMRFLEGDQGKALAGADGCCGQGMELGSSERS